MLKRKVSLTFMYKNHILEEEEIKKYYLITVNNKH